MGGEVTPMAPFPSDEAPVSVPEDSPFPPYLTTSSTVVETVKAPETPLTTTW